MANLFWQHPEGDNRTSPCVHMIPQHPGGDNILVSCTHGLVQQHPNGDAVKIPFTNKTVNVPCTHWVPPHPNGDSHTVPCIHLIPQHPNGDVIAVPCTHLMSPVLIEDGGALVFYTNNTALQVFVRAGIQRLTSLGANLLASGPLNIFNRAPIHGNPNDNSDPFWSHYESWDHAIQITEGLSGIGMRDTLFHEMGHALVGHSSIQVISPGNPHGMHTATDPGEALSEGWAHFVGAAMLNAKTNPVPIFKGENWETLATGRVPSPNIEYSVAMCLWDLFDSVNESGDNTSFSFLELVRVFQPSFPTITSSPVIKDIFDYCDRLIKNNPAKKNAINSVRIKNVGA
jgi:hypothetical protein